MDFIWGINKEADIYCTSVKLSMKSQGVELDNTLNLIAEQMLNEGWEDAPRATIITTILRFVEDHVIESGWSLTDEDGVAWFIGLYCKSFVRSLRHRQESFDDLFKECFIAYFRKH